jgi:hypothetical protein
MKKDIKAWVGSCLKCCKRKTARPLRSGLTQPIVAKYTMHKVAFDIITDLEETPYKGYNAILTCIDVYSRYPWAATG